MYIYRTTNLINGKIYIGKSERRIDESENYFGSGTILNKAIEKYGKVNFKKEILCVVNNINALNFLEIFCISLYKEEHGMNCYNLAKGGDGGNNYRYAPQEIKDEFSKTMSIVTKGENNGFYKKHHTEESKKKISEAKKGWKMSDEHKEIMRNKALGNKINLGRKASFETKAKLSQIQSGEGNGHYGKKHSPASLKLISENIKKSKEEKFICEYCGKAVDKGNYNRWHGDNCKFNPNITNEQLEKRKPWNKKGSETIPKGSTPK